MSESKTVDQVYNGVYRISWHSGGYSVAAVGRNARGEVWVSCANWISGPVYLESIVTWVKNMQLIELSA